MSVDPSLGFGPAGSPSGGAASLTVVDYISTVFRGKAAADGTAQLAAPAPVPAGYLWRVERIGLEAAPLPPASALPPACAVRVASDATEPAGTLGELADYSPTVPAIADEAQPITVPANAVLVFSFSGLVANSAVTARVQYALVRRDTSSS